MSEYVGVVLAAGRGKRMGMLGEDYPKCLLPVGNEPIIGHHLALLRTLGVREVVIIVGHRATDIVRALGEGQRYGVRLRYVEQGGALGSAHALARARPFVRQPFLLLLGDYYFFTPDPSALLRRFQSGRGAVIMAKREPDRELIAEACELRVDGDGRIFGIVEKPVMPVSSLKGCGFYALNPDFFDAVARTPRTALRDEYELTVALELYRDSGKPLYAEELPLRWDTNLTRPEDLLDCNLQWLGCLHRSELVGPDADVQQGARLERVVVGNHARVTKNCDLQDVVVFSGACVDSAEPIRNALVTPERSYLLNHPQPVRV